MDGRPSDAQEPGFQNHPRTFLPADHRKVGIQNERRARTHASNGRGAPSNIIDLNFVKIIYKKDVIHSKISKIIAIK